MNKRYLIIALFFFIIAILCLVTYSDRKSVV